MRSPELAREILWRAVALHVLDTEDLLTVATPEGDAAALLEGLERSGRLWPSAVEALAKLAEVRPREDPKADGETADDGSVEVSVLDAPLQRAIEEASFARIAVRLGALAPDLGARASSGPDRLEDRLVADGSLDPGTAYEIFGIRQSPRAVCMQC